MGLENGSYAVKKTKKQSTFPIHFKDFKCVHYFISLSFSSNDAN